MALLTASFALASQAQEYPTRPIRLIVPFGKGGTPDTLARLIAPELSRALRQQVLVDNRPGNQGVNGSAAVAKAAPDGYTLLMAGPGHAAFPSFLSNVDFDPSADFTVVAPVATLANILVVHPVMPAQNVKSVVDVAHLSPGDFSFASAGAASSSHLAAELLKYFAKIDLRHVPYPSSQQAEPAVVQGDVQILFAPIPAAMRYIQAGKVRPLAVTGTSRIKLLPDLPTMSESGVEGYDYVAWFGVLAPAKTPAPIVQRLSQQIARIVKLPQFAQRLVPYGVDPALVEPQAYAEQLRKEQSQWEAVATVERAVRP